MASILGGDASAAISWRMIRRSLEGNIELGRVWRIYLSSALANFSVYQLTFCI